MPQYHTIEKQKDTLPNIAFIKKSLHQSEVWLLPTRTSEASVRKFWNVLNKNRAIEKESPLYCFEMLFSVNKIPELDLQSDDFYTCNNSVDGWYMIGDLDVYTFVEAFWLVNHDFWVINPDSNFGA